MLLLMARSVQSGSGVTGTGTISDHGRARAPRRGRPELRAQLFVVVECDRPLSGGSRHALEDIDEVVLGRGSARSAVRATEGRTRRLWVRVPDRRMSSRHARLLRRGTAWIFEDLASKNGSQVNGEDCSSTELTDGDWLEVGHTVLRYRAALPTFAEEPLDLDGPELRSLLPELRRGLAELARVAPNELPVLLQGETGTGKEVAARLLHESHRAARPVRRCQLRRAASVADPNRAVRLSQGRVLGSHRGPPRVDPQRRGRHPVSR
jgi:hypothetical protein